MGKGQRYIRTEEIEQIGECLIARFEISEPPVPVEEIANGLGLTIEYIEVGSAVSGVLVMSGETGTIGVNKNDPRVRQRFSVAHEIGHFELHRGSSDVFIDDNFNIHFRDGQSTTGEKREEIQANMLAAALLMPASLLTRQIERGHFDLADDKQLAELASLFQVSVAAMTYRISGLVQSSTPAKRPRRQRQAVGPE